MSEAGNVVEFRVLMHQLDVQGHRLSGDDRIGGRELDAATEQAGFDALVVGGRFDSHGQLAQKADIFPRGRIVVIAADTGRDLCEADLGDVNCPLARRGFRQQGAHRFKARFSEKQGEKSACVEPACVVRGHSLPGGCGADGQPDRGRLCECR